MKSLQLLVLLALTTACSAASESTTSEVEDLRERIEQLESVVDSTTTTEPEVDLELTFNDFSPECSVDRVFRGDVDLTISITNAMTERATFTFLVDLIYYDGEWLGSSSPTIRDVPAGRTGKTDDIMYGAADTKSFSVDDYSCEVAELNYR